MNSADDRINPPELGLLQQGVAGLLGSSWCRCRIVEPSLESRGHGSHTKASLWLECLEELMAVDVPTAGGRGKL